MKQAQVLVRGIGLTVLTLTASTLFFAGCGGNAKTSSVASLATGASVITGVTATASASTSARPPVQRLVAYSACMRAHGIRDFPDPSSQGNLVIAPNDNINPASPQYERAQKACRRLSPEGSGGNGMTPAEHAIALAALTRYVDCIRRHAIPMANPFSGPNGGVGIVLPRDVDPSSQQYKRADATCKHLLPRGG
jgi:hypothetical protein